MKRQGFNLKLVRIAGEKILRIIITEKRLSRITIGIINLHMLRKDLNKNR